MIKYDDTVSSQTTGQPIYGAQVTVLNTQGLQATIYSDEAGTIPLSQPILTDQSGYFSFYIDDGRYNVVVMAGQAEIARTNITMVDTLGIKQRALLVPVNEDGGTIAPADARKGMVLAFDAVTGAPNAVLPNEFAGPTGPANNTYTSYSALQASDPTRKYAYLAGDTDTPARPDGPYSNPTQTTGGWVPQGAAGVTYAGRAPGIVRSTQELLAEGVKCKADFGARGNARRVLKPDGSPDEANFTGTDDTAALKNAFAEAMGNGFELIIERGSFLISDTLLATIGTDQQQPSIRGAGPALTEFIQIDKSKDAIRILGNMPRRDLFAMSGFRVTYPDSWGIGRPTGRAVTVENVRSLTMDGIRTFRSGMGFNLVGCLDVQLRELVTFYDFIGMKLERGTYDSFPNAISFDRCEIQASYKTGLEIVGGCAITIDGASTIENVGVENGTLAAPSADGTSAAMVLTESGFAGSVAIAGRGLYFEANRDYNVYINHANRPALYRFDACNFNRFNDVRIVNDVVFDCQLGDVQTAPAILDLRGSSFTGFNGYTPSVDKKKVAFTTPNGYGGLTFLDDGVLYGEIEEIPEAPLKSRHPQITVLQVGSVNGSIEPVPYPKGINGLQGVERLATGIYAVHPVSRDVRFMSAQVQVIEGGTAITSTVVRAKTAQRAGESAEAFAARPNDYFLIKLYDAAGVLVDGLFELTASGRN